MSKNIIICGTTELSKTLKDKINNLYDVKGIYIDASQAYCIDAKTIFYHIKRADIIIVDLDVTKHSDSFETFFIAGLGKAYDKFVIGAQTDDYIRKHLYSIGYSDTFIMELCDRVMSYDNILKDIGVLL